SEVHERDLVSHAASQELAHRQAAGVPDQVVQRDIDAAEGVVSEVTVEVPSLLGMQAGDYPLRVKRIGADDLTPDRLQDRHQDRGRLAWMKDHRGLAPADQAVV